MEVKPGYKQTEVGLIPEDWETKKIRSVCKLINGRGFKPFEWKKAGLPIIRIQNLNGSDDFNFYQGVYDRKLEVDPGQLLFAWSGSRGTSFGPYVWPGPRGLLNYHTWKMQINESAIDGKFFFHALKKLTEFIEDRAHGASALVHTQKWEMEGFEFPLPAAIPEQRAIASALSDVDALLAKLDQLIAKKRDLKQAAMQQLLTGQTRLPGFSGEWEVKRLRNIVQTPVTDGPHLTPEFLVDGIPFLSVNNLVDNKIDLSDLRFISTADHEVFSRKCKPRKGDVLLGKAASVGKVAIVDTDIEFNIWSPIALIRVGGGNTPRFVYYQLQSAELIQQITLLTNSSSQGNIGMGDIEKLTLRLPSTEEQTAIATVLSNMDAELAALEARRDKTRALKQGMMQELLTGRIRLV